MAEFANANGWRASKSVAAFVIRAEAIKGPTPLEIQKLMEDLMEELRGKRAADGEPETCAVRWQGWSVAWAGVADMNRGRAFPTKAR